MGGSIGEGNTTVSAEFNIYADPEAADVVFRSGLPITMMGLDVTHQALLDRSHAQALRDTGTRSGRIAAELTDFALDRNMQWSRSTVTAIHDAVAIAHLAVPDLVDVAPYEVTLDVTNGPARGRTVCDGQPYRLKRDGRAPNADVGHRDRRRAVRDAAGRRLREPAVAARIPVLLDCDPGHDDALAITLALARPELDVLGITTVGGNVGLRETTRNALRMLALLDRTGRAGRGGRRGAADAPARDRRRRARRERARRRGPARAALRGPARGGARVPAGDARGGAGARDADPDRAR